MMRASIKGESAIPKEVWYVKAFTHEDFAADLAGLIATIQGDCPVPIVAFLAAWQSKHARLAEDYYEKAKETKPGRPKGPPKPESSPYPLTAVAYGIAYIPKKKVGRPATNGRGFDSVTYKAVEEERKKLKASNRTKPRIKDAIDSLNAQVAASNGKQVRAAIKENYQRDRAAYGRGKRQTTAVIKTPI